MLLSLLFLLFEKLRVIFHFRSIVCDNVNVYAFSTVIFSIVFVVFYAVGFNCVFITNKINMCIYVAVFFCCFFSTTNVASQRSRAVNMNPRILFKLFVTISCEFFHPFSLLHTNIYTHSFENTKIMYIP